MNDETRATVEAALAAPALAEARSAGEQMTLDDGLAFALAVVERRDD